MTTPDRVGELRQRISSLNLQLLELLNQRAKLALELSETKQLETPVIYDPAREETMLQEIRQHNAGPFTDEQLELVFRQIFEVSRWLMRDHRAPPPR